MGQEIDHKGLTYSDYIEDIGEWSAKLPRNHEIPGFASVVIKKKGVQVFKGRVQKPGKKYDRNGQSMAVGGPEWTARLIDHKTPHAVIIDSGADEGLNTLLMDSSFPKGTVDTFNPPGDPFIWDSALEMLKFAFNNSCITYAAAEEITDAINGTFQVPPPNRRWVFYSYASGYFYFIVYDADNTLLRYNSTNDFVNWKGWTSFGWNKGAAGEYGLCWDEENGRLFLLVDDGGNVDFYQYSESGGTLTQMDFDDDVDNGDLLVGPIIDSEGDVWWFGDDGGNYNLWEFDYSAATWHNHHSWAKNNIVPRYLFRGKDAGDVIGILWDDPSNDVEEWLWDSSGSSFTLQRKVDDINNVDMGYASGYQTSHGVMFLVWEDEYAGGDADLYFTYRYVDDTAWTNSVKVIDDDEYQSMGLFSLTGDETGNLYLFYTRDEVIAQNVRVIRRFEGEWEEESTWIASDADAASKVGTPASGLACFAAWIDSDDDFHTSLMAPHGISVCREYDRPDEFHGYEQGKDFDCEDEQCASVIESTAEWASEGSQGIHVYVDGKEGQHIDVFGIYTRDYSEVYVKMDVHILYHGIVDNYDRLHFIMLRTCTMDVFRAGWIQSGGTLQWNMMIREGANFVYYNSGVTPELETDYCIEIYWKKHGSQGCGYFWVDGVLMCSATGKDTDNYGDVARIKVGMRSSVCDSPSEGYFDAVAFGGRRIGCGEMGDFKTDAYTASGAMQEWGTLSSPESDTEDNSWSVLKASDDSVLLSGLAVPVDLEEAGLDPLETSIKIKADMIGAAGENYIYDVRVSEKGGTFDMETDHENCYLAVQKAASLLGGESKLNYDDQVDFVHSLGEDKSGTVVFKTARSASYDYDVEVNVEIVNRLPDYQSFANCVKLLGAGTYPDRVEAEAKNYTSIEELKSRLGGNHNGEIWITITDGDAVSEGMAQNRAARESVSRSLPMERITMKVLDEYEPNLIRRGDMVMAVDENTKLREPVRIIGMTVNVAEDGSESTQLEVVARMKMDEYVRHLVSVSDALRWL